LNVHVQVSVRKIRWCIKTSRASPTRTHQTPDPKPQIPKRAEEHMSDENLSDVLDDKADYLAYKKAKTIEKLSERTHLTLEQIGKLASHPEHGTIVGTITLDELIQPKVDAALAEAGINDDEDATEEEEAPVSMKKVAATAKKKTAKKASRAPVRTKKTAKKKAATAKKKVTKKSVDGRKADFGQKKPRLNRDQGYKEIIAALKAAGEPCGRGELEEATGYSGVQVRTFCKELAEQGKVQVLGKGGRSTKYALA